MSAPPLIVLGVGRSGTTLLRVMLDRNSQLALPDESHFLPQLVARHGNKPDADSFVDDLARLPAIRDWGVDPRAVRARLQPGATLPEAVAAIYDEYAAGQGKERWGDKTPVYMQHLGMLDRLFPTAQYVHLIRDGRDTALSFLSMPPGVATKTWSLPRNAGEVACQWRTEIRAARAFGRQRTQRYLEVRYENLVAAPEEVLRAICEFAGLPYEEAMLDYTSVDVSNKPHQQSLRRPPTSGLRDWRTAMSPESVASFEEIAGDLLAELGYELSNPRWAAGPSLRGRLRLSRYRTLLAAWWAAASAVQRSPVWRRRHPRLV